MKTKDWQYEYQVVTKLILSIVLQMPGYEYECEE